MNSVFTESLILFVPGEAPPIELFLLLQEKFGSDGRTLMWECKQNSDGWSIRFTGDVSQELINQMRELANVESIKISVK